MTFGIERSTTPHCTLLHPEKVSFHWRSVRGQPSLCKCEREREGKEVSSERLDLFSWVGYTIRCRSLLCSTVLLDAVISSVHGQITVCSILSGGELQDGEMAGGGECGREEGWRRLCSDLLLHKEDYLFINVSIWTFAIFGCLSRLFVFKDTLYKPLET